jgi:branched-subunit amino acid aminotransferase/4-amino-4-deoxychorismate lyase
MKLVPVQEDEVRPEQIAGRSLFLVNAVRGIVEIATLNGGAVPRDPRTQELVDHFWSD